MIPFRFASAAVHFTRFGRPGTSLCGGAGAVAGAARSGRSVYLSGVSRLGRMALAAGVRDRLQTRVLLGCTGESIWEWDREVEEGPAVSLWLARLDGVQLVPMHSATGAHSGRCQYHRMARSTGGRLAGAGHDAGRGRSLFVSCRPDGGAVERGPAGPSGRGRHGQWCGRAGRMPIAAGSASYRTRRRGRPAQRAGASHDRRVARLSSDRPPLDCDEGRRQPGSGVGGQAGFAAAQDDLRLPGDQ